MTEFIRMHWILLQYVIAGEYLSDSLYLDQNILLILRNKWLNTWRNRTVAM